MKAVCFLVGLAAVAASATKTLHTKVAILGGGVSGINAASNLSSAGIDDFLIIEARDILGGRAQDIPFAGINVELGCNWVQGLGSNPINQLRKKYGLKTAVNNGDDVVFYDNTGKVNATKEYNAFNDAYDRLDKLATKRAANNQADLSGRAGLDLVGWYPTNHIEKAVEYYCYDWEMAENPEVSSTIYSAINDYYTYSSFGPDSDGDRFVIDQRGFKHIFLEYAKTYLKENDDRVKYNTTVTEIKYDKHGVTVHTKNDLVIKADYVICTFSLGVLQNKDVKWSPKLPEWKLEGLYGFHMATYTKIFLNFPHQFWDDNQYTVYADENRRGYFNSWQNLNAPGFFPKNTSTNIFFITVTQDLAYELESLTDEEVKDRAMEVLRTMYGDDIPEANAIHVPRWTSNPLFRGTYSNWPIGELSQHHVNMVAPLHNRVFFAGEAMSADFYGFLQGAWFSGADAGHNVVQCIKHSCPEYEYYPVITNANVASSTITKK